MGVFDARVVVLGLRISQAILAIIVLGLTAYGALSKPFQTDLQTCSLTARNTVANWWSGYWHAMSPSQINFLVFSAVWTILALLYLIVVPWRFSETKLHHKFAILTAECLTMLFWFAGFIALAVFLSDRVCFGHVCSAAKAAAVFGAIEWALFAATTTMASLHVFRSRGSPVHDGGKADPNVNLQEGV
ncbi:hypothetical protein D0865_13007 [Hortaea werneckii]|uniref:MARVEL domain-containing protein n=1 Tax=Hortaea werneckii TaxID=91943 RepID=A0A3M7BGD0_HORWE|nr:hypothetical protein D0865_13007 [Hortaea werneckii]